MGERNSCYTYFKITGDFEPDIITDILELCPEKSWKIGDKRKNNTTYDFALWEIGRSSDYDVYVEKQMMATITPLLTKVDQLKSIKNKWDVSFTLEIVPSIYVNEVNPCLAPSKQIIKFCYETDTDIDIDLYIFNADDE